MNLPVIDAIERKNELTLLLMRIKAAVALHNSGVLPTEVLTTGILEEIEQAGIK